MEMKKIKKALMQGRVRLTTHAVQSMNKRGYTKSDVISCIMSGEKTEVQAYQRKVRVVIEGFDIDNKPIAVVIGRDPLHTNGYALVTVMPPIAEKFKRVI
ncbi:MAG: DUF4258 domain-containing protein [Paenisporosarcina sp.]|nr:DUF4258 domain-containing protein [Paenisporosarcina sp.]